MKVKAKCARTLIRYLKAKESERENSNELCTTKLYYATCRQRVCGQNKDYCIWRSCAFNRRPMTMPILDGVKPMAITLPICGTSESSFWKRKKKHILLDSVETNLNIWRVRWPSPRQVRVQIPTSPRQVRDDRKTSRVRTFFPRWCEQRDNLKCLVLRDCLWFCFYYYKKKIVGGFLPWQAGCFHTLRPDLKHLIKVFA